jgi:hypothetical protein
MNRKKLFTKLNKLCLELDNKYNINCGGCCYVAACIAEQLERFNIPFEIVHYDICGCHYAIKVSDRYINRSDYKKKEIYEILDYNSKEMFSIYYTENWNKTYERKYNSIVHRKIKNLFNENSRT